MRAQEGAIEWERLTASARISDRPLIFFGVIANGGGQAGTVTIYDGANSNGETFHTLHVPASESKLISFLDRGVEFDFGLYITVGNNVDEVTVFWAPLRQD